jgi:hypothetical protein
MKPFLHGRPLGANQTLRSVVTEIPSTGHTHASGMKVSSAPGVTSGTGPTVECIKQGDKVVRLVVTCSCGERIEIECLYQDAG